MFQSLSLFCEYSFSGISLRSDCFVVNSREQHLADPSDATVPLTGERLVRVPLDELQADALKQS
jgi:hypothetical protein